MTMNIVPKYGKESSTLEAELASSRGQTQDQAADDCPGYRCVS